MLVYTSGPRFCRFRWLWYSLFTALLFVVFHSAHPFSTCEHIASPVEEIIFDNGVNSALNSSSQPGTLVAIKSDGKSTSTPITPRVIRPGDILPDNSYDKYLDQPEPFPIEPGGKIGTLHDVREERYFRGGLLTLIASSDSASHPVPSLYDPYPDYNSANWIKSWTGRFQPCEGPRGRDLDRRNPEDMMFVYPGIQEDFPRPKLGGYDTIGLDGQVCTDRYGRYGAYGYGDEHDPVTPGLKKPSTVDWNTVNWTKLESQCFTRNSKRYKTGPTKMGQTLMLPSHLLEREKPQQNDIYSAPPPSISPQYKQRSAVILRAWHNMEWTPNLKAYVRSLVMELSLHSGAEYEIFILVHVKDDIPVHKSEPSVQRLKHMFIPPEFQGMVVFYNDRILETSYPHIEEHSPKFQHFQPLQIFAQMYPDFDYYWQMEADARLTGHMYHFLDRAVEFAKQQPRRYLWERNAYFYSRDAHGPWARFMDMVDDSMVQKPSVWGAVPAAGVDPIGPHPPASDPREDDYQWGVDEEADMITFLPIFDPAKTFWTFHNMLWNLPPDTPRRAGVITIGRTSKRLLDLMHEAQVQHGIALVSEMTPASFCLWHGLKAVHVPHPIYVDGKWTAKELARVMNVGQPEDINGGPDSFWNWDHGFDHIMYRLTYMFTTQTAEDLFRRWMGYKIDPNQYWESAVHQDGEGRNWFDTGDLREDLYGRLCYPPIFLHSIKNEELEKRQQEAVPL